ncbi:MAG: outer membrane lipoprotein chaperone LolA [Brachymonas sp.]
MVKLFSRRSSFHRIAFTTFFIALYTGNTTANEQNGLKNLENFVKSAKSGSSNFTQSVTSPARAGEPPRVKNSSGTFEFQRPNRFKFAYKKPFEQLILADGTSLWIYDADLNQATQRNQASVFASTPAALIASASDLGALRQHFTLDNAPDKDGLSWVNAKPKASDSTLQSVRIGLRGEALEQLDITDSFGQRSVISFANMQVNPSLSADTFKFTLPKGAELLKP